MPAFAPVDRPELLFSCDAALSEVLLGELDELDVEEVVVWVLVVVVELEEAVVWALVEVADDEELEVVLEVSRVVTVTPWEPIVTTSTL